MFFEFSSALSTTQPRILANNLITMRTPNGFIHWILAYLPNRTQFVCHLKYQLHLESFVDYCETNYRQLNISKTKELFIDVRFTNHQTKHGMNK